MQIEKRTNYPELDKEMGDSIALKPVLNDFRITNSISSTALFPPTPLLTAMIITLF